jgi:hypothetical protein
VRNWFASKYSSIISSIILLICVLDPFLMGDDMFDDYIGDYGAPPPFGPSVSPVKISINIGEGNEILIYVQNQGENIIIVKRINLVVEYGPNHQKAYSLRKDDFLANGDEVVEQHFSRLMFWSAYSDYQGDFSGITKARCTAEYLEVTGRVSSKVYIY